MEKERYISADKLKAHYAWWENGSAEMTLDEAKTIFDTVVDVQPTVDAEPVVRCNDCKYYSADGWGFGNCYRPNVDYLRMKDNSFCSEGERKEDANTHNTNSTH